MKKALALLLTAIIFAATLTACSEQIDDESLTETSQTTAAGKSVTQATEIAASDDVASDEKDRITENTTEQKPVAEAAEGYYQTYVLGKRVVDGKETVFLTDERDMDSWQVPVKDAVAGDGFEFERIRFIGIDWKADGTVEQVYMSDFLTSNTFGSLVNPGSSGKLSVNSYGADAGDVPDHSEWDMIVNGTEVVLINEQGTEYYFYEDHFGEQATA